RGAFESELVFVNIRYYDDSLPASAKGDLVVASPAIIDGLNYIFQYADSVGKPAVVNLSWGMHTGPHDGTSLFDLAIDNLTGPGKIFVGAAGNSGWSRTHISAKLQGDTLRTLPFNNRNVRDDVEDMYIDLWGSSGTSFSISLGLADTNGFVIQMTDFIPTTKDTVIDGMLRVPNIDFTEDTLRYILSIVSSNAGNGKPNMLMELFNQTPQTRRTVLYVYSDSSEVHAWNSGQIYSWGNGGFAAAFWGHPNIPGFTGGNATYVVGENGGTGKSTITVGAYNASKTTTGIDGNEIPGGWGNFALFSSQGPTVDGRMKPDIAAPGETVISAYNRNAYRINQRGDIVDTVVWNGFTHYWGVASGTSMASPNACGVIALFLQADSTLTPDQIRSILSQTATLDDMTVGAPGNAWGWGKINAYGGLLHIQNKLGVRQDSDHPRLSIYPNPGKNHFTLWGIEEDLPFQIVDVQGKVVSEGRIVESQLEVNLKPGLYFVRLMTPSGMHSLRLQITP
ncbi:MAG: S8 family peptidase, partial [Bacteroidota bacterium]|nr:S8 family peptidase [Bacteroidota bacterium]MDX5429683.1 S8 family peptidase [Bacteroidota bacterium]MDX5468461.1 S8 family peptidase [Bacteroidota bacterium]